MVVPIIPAFPEAEEHMLKGQPELHHESQASLGWYLKLQGQ